jgi:hypothetical protein
MSIRFAFFVEFQTLAGFLALLLLKRRILQRLLLPFDRFVELPTSA